MRRWMVALSLVVLAPMNLPSAARADFPVMIHQTEELAPTNEDWLRYFLQKSMRAKGILGPCGACTIAPIVLVPEIIYLPFECEPCRKQGHVCHSSPGRGTYGILHPMPYYIPNPTIAVETGGCASPMALRENWRFPNNRVVLTLGTWE